MEEELKKAMSALYAEAQEKNNIKEVIAKAVQLGINYCNTRSGLLFDEFYTEFRKKFNQSKKNT